MQNEKMERERINQKLSKAITHQFYLMSEKALEIVGCIGHLKL